MRNISEKKTNRYKAGDFNTRPCYGKTQYKKNDKPCQGYFRSAQLRT